MKGIVPDIINCTIHHHKVLWCINGTCTFNERYSALHHKLPIKSYCSHVPMFRSTVVQLVPNYREFPADSKFSFMPIGSIDDAWQQLQPFE